MSEERTTIKMIVIFVLCFIIFSPWVAIGFHYACALVLKYWVWTGVYDLMDFVEVTR